MKQDTLILTLRNNFNSLNFYIVYGNIDSNDFLVEVGDDLYMYFKPFYKYNSKTFYFTKLIKRRYINNKIIYSDFIYKDISELKNMIYDRDYYKISYKKLRDHKSEYESVDNIFLECNKEDILYILSTNKALEENLTELILDRKQEEPIYYIQEKVIKPLSVLEDIEILWFKLKTTSKNNLLFGLKIENNILLKGGYIYINDSYTGTIKITDTISAIPYSKYDKNLTKSIRYITESTFFNKDSLNKAILCFGTNKDGKIIPIKCNIQNRKIYNLDIISHFNHSIVKRYLKKELDKIKIKFSKQLIKDNNVCKYILYCFGEYDLNSFDAIEILKTLKELDLYKYNKK